MLRIDVGNFPRCERIYICSGRIRRSDFAGKGTVDSFMVVLWRLESNGDAAQQIGEGLAAVRWLIFQDGEEIVIRGSPSSSTTCVLRRWLNNDHLVLTQARTECDRRCSYRYPDGCSLENMGLTFCRACRWFKSLGCLFRDSASCKASRMALSDRRLVRGICAG